MEGLRRVGDGQRGPSLPEPHQAILGAEIARRYLVSGTPVAIGRTGIGFRTTDLLSGEALFAELLSLPDAARIAEALQRGIPLEGPPVEVLLDGDKILVLRRAFSGVRQLSEPTARATSLLHACAEAAQIGLEMGIAPTELVRDEGRPRLATIHGLTQKTTEAEVFELLERLAPDLVGPLREEHGTLAEVAQAHASRHVILPHVKAPPLVGVTKLVNRIEGRLTTGSSPSMVLSGPAGIGKSRTLTELRRRLVRRGLSVATIRATQRCDGPLLLWAAASTLDPEHRGVLESVRSRLISMPGVSADWLEDPTAAAGPEPHDLDLDGRHRRYCRVLAECVLELITAQGDGVLLIDDADQLDASSQTILAEIRAMDAHQQRLAIVATAREPDRVASDIAISHLAIPGLDAEAVSALIDATVADAELLPHLADRLLAQVGPRPLHLWAWLRFLCETGMLWSPEHAGGSALVDLQERRLRELSEPGRAVLEICALHPETWTLNDLASVLSMSSAELGRAVDELRHSGLVRSAGHQAIRVGHSTTTETVCFRTAPAAQRQRHEVLAQWLARSGKGSTPLVTRHRELATPPGPSAALSDEHLGAAETALTTYDLDAARWHLERVSERAPGREHARKAQRGLAHIDLLTGDLESAELSYSELIDEAPPEEALALAREVMYGFYRRNAAEMAMAIGTRALRVAGEWLPTFTPALIFAVLWTLIRPRREAAGFRDGLAAIYTQMVPLAASHHRGLLVLSVLRGQRVAHELPTQWGASAHGLMAMLWSTAGFSDRASQSIELASSYAESCGAPRAKGEVEHLRGQMALANGDYANGQAALERAVDHFEQAGDMTLGTITLYMRADYGLQRETDGALRRWIQAADDAARRQGNLLVRPSLSALLLLVDARSGREVQGRFSSIRRRLDSLDPATLDAVVGRSLFALALYETGHHTEAETAIREASAGEGPGSLEIQQHLYYARGLADRDPSAGPAALKKLEALGKSSPRAWVSARLLAAELCLRRGDQQGARSEVEAVIDTEGHGETRLLARAERILGEITGDPTVAERSIARIEELEGGSLDEDQEEVAELHPVLNSLREISAPRAITIEVSELSELDPSTTSVVLLIAMAVRDQTTGEMSVRLATRDTVEGRRTIIDISAGGARQTAPLGLSGVRNAVQALGGVLSVGPSLSTRRIVVELPPSKTSQEGAISVVHDDPKVARALEEAVRGLGYRLAEPAAAALVITNQLNTPGNTLRVVPRAQRGPGDLPFPFGLGELAVTLHHRVGPAGSPRENSG